MKKLWKTLGPGFLYAGAAVGVSHLVQSTSAGAKYGFLLVGVVLLSNLFKYPFFEAGPRYAAATGTSLIEGYLKIGKWAVWLFALLTFTTAFSIQAAVTAVTAVLFSNFFDGKLSTINASIILLFICSLILIKGKYKLLDNVIKYVVVLLSITSLIAFIKASTLPIEKSLLPDWSLTNTSFVFLLALLGWMPAPLDISVWHSIWTLEKKNNNKGKFTIAEALRDFHIGYWGTAFLAVLFLSLGALVLYNQGVEFETSASKFAKQFISIYTHTLGDWTYYIIAIAAFATMFSTTITVLDGAPRVIKELYKNLSVKKLIAEKNIYNGSIILICSGALVIITFIFSSLATLLTIATIASFLTAPIIAFLNYKLIFGGYLPANQQPSKFNKYISLIGILLLIVFSIAYILHFFNLIHFG